MPLAVGLGVVAGILTGVVVDDWWHPFPDRLPARVLVWIGLAVSAVALMVLRFGSLGWNGLVGTCCGAVVVVLAASQGRRWPGWTGDRSPNPDPATLPANGNAIGQAYLPLTTPARLVRLTRKLVA
ncbi:putative membrane protein YedE/YeeE [Catenulispora sp. MAP5-51]